MLRPAGRGGVRACGGVLLTPIAIIPTRPIRNVGDTTSPEMMSLSPSPKTPSLEAIVSAVPLYVLTDILGLIFDGPHSSLTKVCDKYGQGAGLWRRGGGFNFGNESPRVATVVQVWVGLIAALGGVDSAQDREKLEGILRPMGPKYVKRWKQWRKRTMVAPEHAYLRFVGRTGPAFVLKCVLQCDIGGC